MGESFKDVVAWQRAVQMTVEIYKLTSQFPDSERYGLSAQLRRASVSVASNIAEGYGRSSKGEYILFLGHARGSNSEVETQLVIARALGFGSKPALETAEKLCNEVGRLIGAMMMSLRSKSLVPIP